MLKNYHVTGPVCTGSRGWAYGCYFGDICQNGYIEEEYFIEGESSHYRLLKDLTPDGKWELEKVDPVPYKTRFLVQRPADAADFNGTVVVEWTNVSSGHEMTMTDLPALYQNGFAYVAASVQPTGIEGFASKPRGLKWWDFERYGSLHIADDAVSYDIYSQIGDAVGPDRETEEIDPMGGLQVEKLIGIGASQSGGRLMAYLNGVHPLDHVYHGFIPTICSGSAADFDTALGHGDSAAGDTSHSRSVRTWVREDLDVPTLEFNTQTESLYYVPMRQPDTDRFRSWEIAGAAHLSKAMADAASLKSGRDGMKAMTGGNVSFVSAVNWGAAMEAAIVHMHKWMRGAALPPHGTPIETNGKDYVYDVFGNVKGGIRLPEVEVPTAKYVAGPQYPLGGYTQAFPHDLLKNLYPTNAEYVAKVQAAAQNACDAGFLLPYRVKQYTDEAAFAPVPDTYVPEAKVQIRATPKGKGSAR